MGHRGKPDSDELALEALAGAESAIRLAWTDSPTLATDEVVRRVRSGHVADRRDATRRLGQIIARNRHATREAIDALAFALHDADAQVRISAIDALDAAATVRADIAVARRALAGSLSDDLAVVRRAAITLLAKVAGLGLDADDRQLITGALGDRDVGVRAEASAALLRATRAGGDLSRWLVPMIAALDDDDMLVRGRVRDALGEIVERDRDDARRVLGLLVRPRSARSDEARDLASQCRRVLRDPATSAGPPAFAPPPARPSPAAPRPRFDWLAGVRRWWTRVWARTSAEGQDGASRGR